LPPLTLKILATLAQMHGSDATIMSDNQGVEDLLGNIRSSLEEGGPNASSVMLAAYNKQYVRFVPYAKIGSQRDLGVKRAAPSYAKTTTRR
jgi:hypothetical protein